jgi:hypothetical protein
LKLTTRSRVAAWVAATGAAYEPSNLGDTGFSRFTVGAQPASSKTAAKVEPAARGLVTSCRLEITCFTRATVRIDSFGFVLEINILLAKR